MKTLIHAADLHLDSPFSGLSPAKAVQRRAEQRMLLDRLTALCNEREAELLLLSGDLFDGAHVYRDTVEALCRALGACRAQVFIAPGNHDPVTPDSPYRTAAWPKNVHIFLEQRITAVELEELGCRVYGAGFRSAVCDEALLAGFRAEQDGLCNLMVLHGDACGGMGYNPVTKEQIAVSGLDYLALGHIHRRGQIQAGKTLAAWPGCAMGRGFDECGEKGALVVTLESGAARTAFVPLGARRYEVLEISVVGDALASVEAALPADTVSDIYRIILRGECAAADLASMQLPLRDRFYALELLDRTVPPLALWDAAVDDSLKGRMLSRLKAQYDHAQGEDRQTVLLAARYALSIFEGREVPPL